MLPKLLASAERALERAVSYANERVVFGRKIGKNQSIQHPLAECWSELYAAELMTLHAAELYDLGRPSGAQANARSTLLRTQDFMRAIAQCGPTAAWDMPASITSKDIFAKWSQPGWHRSRVK